MAHFPYQGSSHREDHGNELFAKNGADCRPSFFLLRAAKVRSSYEEGPGQSALQSAYHDPQLDVIKMKQNRTT